jgi:beta-RFAP synthase
MPSNLSDRALRKSLQSVRSGDRAAGAASFGIETISAARLHFGFLDVSGSLGRRFGSIGLSISSPGIRVRVRFAGELSVEGRDPDAADAAMKYAAMFYDWPEVRDVTGGLPKAAIFLDQTIPSHCGYGSGTQLALCVASSLCRLYGFSCSPARAALLTGRGKRSGIGIESFAGGGFIVDAGAGSENSPLTLFRADFPANWRIITVLPPDVSKGLNGRSESRAFMDMPEADPSSAKEICHIVMMMLLPALLENKLDIFGEAVGRIQEITGENFAGVQSGRFASPMAEDIFQKMGELGAAGMGQSSWGPLIYGFANGEKRAAAVASGLKKYFSGAEVLSGGRLGVSVVSGRNNGALIRPAA